MKKTVVWSAVRNLDYALTLGSKFREKIAQTEIEIDTDSIDILKFAEKWQTLKHTNIALVNAFTKYDSEAHYRKVIATLFSSGTTDSYVVISEPASHKNIPALFRSLRALGIESMLEIATENDQVEITFSRGLANFNPEFWNKHPAPYLRQSSIDAAVDFVNSKIEDRRALSLIRIGHCEVRFLGLGLFYGPTDLNSSAELQWGSKINVLQMEQVGNSLASTVKNADVLGFYSREKFSAHPLKILDNSVANCLSVRSLLNGNQLQTSPNIHFELAKSLRFIENIKSAKKVILVSPRTTTFAKIKKMRKGETCLVKLPGEARVDGSMDINSRFSQFRTAENLLKESVTEGSLVLVGGGVAGKSFCEVAKRQGGLGIDIGSVLDAWADIDSRGSGFSDELKNSLFKVHDSKGRSG